MQRAIVAVRNGLTLRKASSHFGVPFSTLRRRYLGLNSEKVGHPTVLSYKEETRIVHALELASECGWPCNRLDIKMMVQEYCSSSKRLVPWGETGPGKDFICSFFQRWKTRLSLRRPQILKKASAHGLNENVIEAFFKKLEHLYERFGFHENPDRVFNVDEFGLCTDEKMKCCVARRGMRNVNVLNPTCGKTSYTVLACGNAVGELMPPFIIYKGKHLYDMWCSDGPKGTAFCCSMSGWMDSVTFAKWLEKVMHVRAYFYSHKFYQRFSFQGFYSSQDKKFPRSRGVVDYGWSQCPYDFVGCHTV